MRKEEAEVKVTPAFDLNSNTEFNLDTYKQLLDDRVILLNGDITENVIERAVIQIARLSKEKPKEPIIVVINSFGGSTYDAQALVDVMLYTKTPITTVCLGKAMSAAFDIFLAGDHRVVHKNSLLMCHAGSENLGEERLPMINDSAKLNQEFFKRWATFYASRTKMDYDEWYKLIDSGRDHFFFPERAVELGLAHEIHQPQTKYPYVDKTKHKKSKVKKKR